jgi:hypothetical protein
VPFVPLVSVVPVVSVVSVVSVVCFVSDRTWAVIPQKPAAPVPPAASHEDVEQSDDGGQGSGHQDDRCIEGPVRQKFPQSRRFHSVGDHILADPLGALSRLPL